MQPSLFWSEVRLGHRVDRKALCGFVLLAVVLIYACGASWVLLWASGLRGRAPWPIGLTTVSLLWPWVRSTNPYFWLVPVSSVLAPLVFLVLGTSLDRAKVRREHVWRAGVYGFLGVATIMLGFRLARVAILLVSPGRVPRVPTDLWEFLVVCGFRSSWAMVAAGAWMGVFWWCAVSKYLRLESPRAVTASVMAISMLGALAVVQWWPGSLWDWWRVDLFRVFFW